MAKQKRNSKIPQESICTFIHCICSFASFNNLLENIPIITGNCKKLSGVWPTLYNVEYALVLKVKGQENAVTAVFEFSTFIRINVLKVKGQENAVTAVFEFSTFIWIKIFFLCVKTAYVHLSSRDCLCMYIYESTFNYTSRSLLSIIATCTLHNNPWMFVLTFHRSFKRTRHWANWPYWFDCMSSAIKYS